jgi:hypothetical protein
MASNNVSGLSAVETMALATVIESKIKSAARDEIAVGVYDVNTLVRISGQVKVGEDYPKPQVNKIDWIGLVAVALSKLNGVTVEALVEEYEMLDGVNLKDIKDSAQAKIDLLKGKTMQMDRGRVTTNLTATMVEDIDRLAK